MARIRTKRKKQSSGPKFGCQQNFEDMRYAHNVLDIKAQPRRVTAPMVQGGGNYSVRQVETRIMTGMKTLRALPDRERRFFIVKSSSPDYVQEYIDAYASAEVAQRFQPNPQDINEYLEALSWLRHLDKNKWKLLWFRSFGLSFGLIGEYIGRSDETARNRYKEAVTDAWIAANSGRKIQFAS